MPAIQKLYNACKVSLTPNGPVSEEAIEKVRALLVQATLLSRIGSLMNLFPLGAPKFLYHISVYFDCNFGLHFVSLSTLMVSLTIFVQNDLIHAWGLDMQLGYCAQGERTKNVGVVDSEYIVHHGLPTL